MINMASFFSFFFFFNLLDTAGFYRDRSFESTHFTGLSCSRATLRGNDDVKTFRCYIKVINKPLPNSETYCAYKGFLYFFFSFFWGCVCAVSYTHLTLPTTAEV